MGRSCGSGGGGSWEVLTRRLGTKGTDLGRTGGRPSPDYGRTKIVSPTPGTDEGPRKRLRTWGNEADSHPRKRSRKEGPETHK